MHAHFIADDYARISISSAGDVNSDRFDDLIIGADRNDEGGTDAGVCYDPVRCRHHRRSDTDGHGGGDQLSGTEAIDFSGSDNNTLLLNDFILLAAAGDVNNLTETAESLLIDGNAGNEVDAGAGWSNTGYVTIGGRGYSLYESDDNGSQLVIKENVNVNG